MRSVTGLQKCLAEITELSSIAKVFRASILYCTNQIFRDKPSNQGSITSFSLNTFFGTLVSIMIGNLDFSKN